MKIYALKNQNDNVWLHAQANLIPDGFLNKNNLIRSASKQEGNHLSLSIYAFLLYDKKV